MRIILFLILLTLCKSNEDSSDQDEENEIIDGLSRMCEEGDDDCPPGPSRSKDGCTLRLRKEMKKNAMFPAGRFEGNLTSAAKAMQEIIEEVGEDCATRLWSTVEITVKASMQATGATARTLSNSKPKGQSQRSTTRISTLGILKAVGFNVEPPKFNESQVEDIFEGTGMSEMQKRMMMYIYSSVMKGNDRREKDKIAWVLSWMNKKNKVTPLQPCQCPYCPEELCPGCSKNEVVTIQGGSHRVHLILGQYKYDPKIQTYVQMTNTTDHFDFAGDDGDLMVAISSIYLYRVPRSGWYVGLAPGKTKGMLYNPSKSSSLPMTGWQYQGPLDKEDGNDEAAADGSGNDEEEPTLERLHWENNEEEEEEEENLEEEETEWDWVTDPSIKITNGNYSWCETIYVTGEGVSLDCKLFGAFTRSNKFAVGRPVYFNDHGAALHAGSVQGWKLQRGNDVLKINLPDDEPMSTLNPVILDFWSKEAEVSVTFTCSDISSSTTSQQGKRSTITA